MPASPARFSRLLIPWLKLIRFGIPHLRVIRRPLTFAGVTYEVNSVLPPEVTCHRVRMRQLYEGRLLAPVEMSVLVKSVDVATGEVDEVAKGALLVDLHDAPHVGPHAIPHDVPEEDDDFMIDADPSLGVLPFDPPTIELEEDGDTGTEYDSIDPATIPLPPPVYKGTNKRTRTK